MVTIALLFNPFADGLWCFFLSRISMSSSSKIISSLILWLWWNSLTVRSESCPNLKCARTFEISIMVAHLRFVEKNDNPILEIKVSLRRPKTLSRGRDLKLCLFEFYFGPSKIESKCTLYRTQTDGQLLSKLENFSKKLLRVHLHLYSA